MTGLVCGFDILPGGQAVPVARLPDRMPDPRTAPNAVWRWLHFEVDGLHDWASVHLPRIAGETLCQTETRPRCDRFADGVAINLRGVNLNAGDRAEDMVSLRIWATDTLVITARLRKIMTMDTIRRQCEAGEGPATPGRFISLVAAGLTDRSEAVALGIEEGTDTLEEASLGTGHASTEQIITFRRAVIMLRRFAGPQRDALVRLATLDSPLLSDEVRLRLHETANRATRMAEALDALRDRLVVLQDHADARANDRMGRNSYVLSVIAAVFLPLGFATGLFGVNVAGMPGTEYRWAFWILAAAMAGLGVGLLALFRWMRWL